jgi:hypothetical protein
MLLILHAALHALQMMTLFYATVAAYKLEFAERILLNAKTKLEHALEPKIPM